MALIVEDGTSKADAESYISVADADLHIAAFYGADALWDAALDASKEQALRQATRYLDNQYSFVGNRKTSTQNLDWPRYLSTSETDGKFIDDVPDVLAQATAELALKSINGTSIFPDTAVGGNVKKIKVGTIEKEFSEKRVNNQPIFHVVDNLLKIIIAEPNQIIRA